MIRERFRDWWGESAIVEELRGEIDRLRHDRARLEDLLLQKAGLLSKDVLPGVQESNTPIGILSRRAARLEAEEKYRKMAEEAVEEMRKAQ